MRGSVGYRAGIHMKAYRDRFPIVVVGGIAKDYLGEYMAGGILAVLNLDSQHSSPAGEYVGTSMHGGVIYLRGRVEAYQLGLEVGVADLDEADWRTLSDILTDYGKEFSLAVEGFSPSDFIKLTPQSSRPYGRLYAY